MDYEEAYSYSFIVLAFAMALCTSRKSPALSKYGYLMGALGGCCAAFVYLSKSSMILFAGLYAAIHLYKLPKAGPRLLLLSLFLSAPGGWALYQHHVGGRYSLGTSLDGFNLHMGNSWNFLRDYPPLAGRTLDDTAEELNVGTYFEDEWRLNEYHKQAAVDFRDEPSRSGSSRRSPQALHHLFPVKEVGTYKDHGLFALWIETRIFMFRSALLLSLFCIATNRLDLRGTAVTFYYWWEQLSFLALGFAYTRHFSV